MIRAMFALCLAVCALAPCAHAGSLRNGDFDSNLSHWTVTSSPNVSAIHVAEDAAGQAGSGAAELRDANPGAGGAQSVLSQCVNLAGASFPVPYAAKAKVVLEGEAAIQAYLLIDEHDAPNCPPGSYIGLSRAHIVNDSQVSWQSFSGSFTPFDGSVQAVLVTLALQKPIGTGVNGAVRFDQIQFGVPGPELTRWTIDAGGGYLSAGNIVLQGTVGQPDAGRLTGGGIVLRSGFWAGAMTAPGDAIFMDGFEN